MPRLVVQPALELKSLLREQGLPILRRLRALVVAVAREDVEARRRAVEDLGRALSGLIGLTTLLARARVMELVQANAGLVAEARPMFFGGVSSVPNTTWEEAVAQIADRYPMLVPVRVRQEGSLAVAEWIGELYDQYGFTLARTADQRVVEYVQRTVSRALDNKLTKKQAIKQIIAASEEMQGDPFTRAYAETIFRNNVATAYSAGIHQQMQDPVVREVIGGLQFVAAMDSDTTDICQAAHGTVAPSDHAIWDERTPPLHHNCRSGLHFLTHRDMRRMGLVDQGGATRAFIPNYPPKSYQRPQPGFGRRRT